MRGMRLRQAGWNLVAEGSLWDIRSKVGELELPKGSRLRIVMDCNVPAAWAFDIAPNWAFPAPTGMEVVDIWGEGSSTGIVELEADPAWLVAVLGFIAANWLRIVIGTAVIGFTLGLIVTIARVFASVPIPEGTWNWLVIGLIAVAAIWAWQRPKRARAP